MDMLSFAQLQEDVALHYPVLHAVQVLVMVVVFWFMLQLIVTPVPALVPAPDPQTTLNPESDAEGDEGAVDSDDATDEQDVRPGTLLDAIAGGACLSQQDEQALLELTGRSPSVGPHPDPEPQLQTKPQTETGTVFPVP
jgi:hypothetical protein